MLDVTSLKFPEQYPFEEVAASFFSYVNSLPSEARVALGDFLLALGSGGSSSPGTGSPQSEFTKAALTWLGQSVKDGQLASAPANLTIEAAAAAGVEVVTDSLIGVALAVGVSALFWSLPITIIGGPAVVGAVVAVRLGGLLPALLTMFAPFVGKFIRGKIVDLLKASVSDLHDEMNQLYWDAGGLLADYLLKPLLSALKHVPDLFHSAMRDPIVLDLNGDGITLTSLSGSNVHFDYAGDGFAERTGWVAPTDGILAIDLNGNGKIDNGLELFGSPTEDGFAVLEKLDTNGDGVIDANDADFSKLLVWRDLNQNGVSDPGELESLADAGIASISLRTQKVNGTNAGNNLGYQATFTRTDGATGTAETIYFSTDTQDSVADNTPDFTPSDDALSVPQLPGSGLINSIAFKATNDPNFLAAWTALTDAAPNLNPAELNSQFKDLLLRWAGVDGVDPVSRGPNVDARHLAFLEKFYGTIYLNDHDSGVPLNWQGRLLEQEFASIVAIYETAFLAQAGAASLIRGTGDISAALNNPYFFYSLLDFNSYAADDPAVPATPGNVGMVVQLMLAMAPDAAGAQTDYLIKGLSGLTGVIGTAFGGDKAAYAATLEPFLEDGIADDANRSIATKIVDGTALFGTTRAEGINGTSGEDLLIGGVGSDLLMRGVETGSGRLSKRKNVSVRGKRRSFARYPANPQKRTQRNVPRGRMATALHIRLSVSRKEGFAG